MRDIEGFKDSPLGLIPNDWEVVKIGDRIEISYGKSQKNVRDKNGEIPVYGTGGIIEMANDFLFDGESILIGRKGTIDKPFYITGKFWTVDTAYYVSNTNEISVKWLYSTLISLNLSKLNEATGVPSLNRDLLYRQKIAIPSLAEQQKIAEILTTADNVITETQTVIAKYKALKVGMMQDLFTRGIDTATGALRPTPSVSPHLYKDSPLGLIPIGWVVVEIRKISSLVTNGFVGIATPYYTERDNGVPYLFGTNVRANYLDFNDIRYINKEFHSKHVKSNLKQGDLLTVQSGHIGTTAVVPDNLGEANCHALIITRFDLKIVNPYFVSYYLNSDIGMHDLEELFVGSTIKHINTSDLAKHEIILPPIVEQTAISERLQSLDAQIAAEEENLKKYEQLKAGLMQDLLRGVVRVKS